MRVVAFYLPQFHEIPENNEWWGNGFTEWVNVKKAQPLFEGHNQPRVPLHQNYYDLADPDTMRRQVHLAREYGVHGFCFYHYWFGGKLLLEKPVERFLRDKDLDFYFCLCWANEHWTNAWAKKEANVLIEQHYGGPAEWKQHFNYFLPFFQDRRYITNGGKPLLVLYRPELIGCLNKMLDFWNDLAIQNGFPGIDFAYQHAGFTFAPNCDESRFAYALEYHPNCAQQFKDMQKHGGLKRFRKGVMNFVENALKVNLRDKLKPDRLTHFDYDALWAFIVNMRPRSEKCIPGAFVDWDNTPRKGTRGFVVDGASPEKFERYMTRQIEHARKDYQKDMLFIFSWNEWAEGGYLEPDEKNGYGYLEALRSALTKNGEFPI